MSKTAPISFSPSATKNHAATNPAELLVEHQRAPQQKDPDENSNTEAGDSGTKGTGSAG